MVSISLHYWAGARAAAGVDDEVIEADTVAAALRSRLRRSMIIMPLYRSGGSSTLPDAVSARPPSRRDVDSAAHLPVLILVHSRFISRCVFWSCDWIV